MTRIVLAIMAKASIDVLANAIASAHHLVDAVCLVVAPDDPLLGSQRALRTACAGKPAYVFGEEWRGHAKTRGITLQHASKIAEWVLMIDADDTLAPGATLPDLSTADSFDIPVDCTFPGGRWRWLQPGHLMRADHVRGWNGMAGLHEVLDLVPGSRVARHDGMVYRVDQTGHTPVRAGGRTYLADAEKLEGLVLANPSDTRAAYYFAQSLRDAGEPLRAYHAYLHRASMKDGIYEETFWALLWAAKLASFVGVPEDEVIARYQDAHRFCPERAEPLHDLALVHRGAGRYEQAIALMNEANARPYPTNARWLVDVMSYSWDARQAAGILDD